MYDTTFDFMNMYTNHGDAVVGINCRPGSTTHTPLK